MAAWRRRSLTSSLLSDAPQHLDLQLRRLRKKCRSKWRREGGREGGRGGRGEREGRKGEREEGEEGGQAGEREAGGWGGREVGREGKKEGGREGGTESGRGGVCYNHLSSPLRLRDQLADKEADLRDTVSSLNSKHNAEIQSLKEILAATGATNADLQKEVWPCH